MNRLKDAVMIQEPLFSLPAKTLFTRLLNQSLRKAFYSEDVTATVQSTETSGAVNFMLPDPTGLWRERHLTRARVKLASYSRSFDVTYYRLVLSQWLSRAYVRADADAALQDVLLQLYDRYGLFLSADEVDYQLYGTEVEEGVFRALIRAKPEHLIWTGALEVYLVPHYHLSLYCNITALPQLSFQDQHLLSGTALETVL